MSKTLNAFVFDTFSNEKDVTILRDFSGGKLSLAYKRSAPKRVKDFPGMEKSELKLTVTDPTLGVVAIVSSNTSIRADADDATRSSTIATMLAAMADSAYTQLVQDQRLPISV